MDFQGWNTLKIRDHFCAFFVLPKFSFATSNSVRLKLKIKFESVDEHFLGHLPGTTVIQPTRLNCTAKMGSSPVNRMAHVWHWTRWWAMVMWFWNFEGVVEQWDYFLRLCDDRRGRGVGVSNKVVLWLAFLCASKTNCKQKELYFCLNILCLTFCVSRCWERDGARNQPKISNFL